MTHLSIGVIIYLEGLSGRHPKGARSIGIGHPRSGDRCTKTLPYHLDPLWVAEQSLQRPRQGVAHTSQSISATPWRGRDCLLCPVHGSSGLRPLTRGYGAGTHKGCFVHHSSLLDEYDPLHAYTAAGGCFAPHSSLLDEWLRCLSNASPPGDAPGMTHLSIGVIIYLEGLSGRHPKGARSIGIGHPRSGDRCTEPHLPLDPLWVAEQSLQRPCQGVAHTSQSISATP